MEGTDEFIYRSALGVGILRVAFLIVCVGVLKTDGAFYFHVSLRYMMNGHSELEKPRSRCEPVFLERYGLVSDMLDFIYSGVGFSVCMCMLQLLMNPN